MAKKVFVIIHSLYGHVKSMAEHIASGLKEGGVEATIYRVPETLPEEVLQKMHAAKFDDIPVITAADLEKADGYLFGLATRYGTPSAQIRSFMDSTGQLWVKGALAGKYAGVFTSTATQHGGIETTALTFLPNLFHHGIIFVPQGYTSGLLGETGEIIAGSPYGAGCIAGGDGSRQLTDKDIQVCKAQGKYFAGVLNKVQ